MLDPLVPASSQETPRPPTQHKSWSKIQYLLDYELEPRDIGVARVRSQLIPDAGLLPSGPRFLDDPMEVDSGHGGDAWKGGGSLGKHVPSDIPSLPSADFEKASAKSERAEEARQVEVAAKAKFGSIEIFLNHLDRKFGATGAFTYPGFSLAEFANQSGMQTMVKEVALAIASLLVEDTKILRELPKDERELAVEVLSARIIG